MGISLKNVSKNFSGLKALNNISFNVSDNSIHGFLGPNGAGKTTTMNIISGLLKASSGIVEIEGKDISENPIFAKTQVGYLPEWPPLYLDQKVEEFLQFIGRIRKVEESELKKRLEDILEKCQLTTVRQRLIGNLSKGYKQRVGLAQALIHNPKVIILDEPTNGLDPLAISQMRELIKNLRKKHTVLLSSHLLHEVSDMCDTITLVKKGQIIKSGPQEEILKTISPISKMRVVANNMDDNVVEKIKRWELVKKLEVIRDDNKHELMISFSDNSDHRVEMSKILIEAGAVPLELKLQKPNLEEAYKGLIIQ